MIINIMINTFMEKFKETSPEENLSFYDSMVDHFILDYKELDKKEETLKRMLECIDLMKTKTKDKKLYQYFCISNYELLNFFEKEKIKTNKINKEDTIKNMEEYCKRTYKTGEMPEYSSPIKKMIDYQYNNGELTIEKVNYIFATLLRTKSKYGTSIKVDEEIIKDCMTTFTKKVLKDFELDCKVEWTDQLKKTVIGQYCDNKIELNKTKITGRMIDDIEMIRTIFHEVTHAVQDQKFSLDYLLSLKIAKDEYINHYHKGKPGDINYILVSHESDARLKSNIYLKRYLEEIAPDVAEAYIDDINRRIKREEEILSKEDRILYNDISNVDEAFDHLPKSYRAQAASRSGILELEYDEFGDRKDLAELYISMKRQEPTIKSSPRSEQLYLAYKKMIENRQPRPLQAIKDYQSLQKAFKKGTINEEEFYQEFKLTSFKESVKRNIHILKSKLKYSVNKKEVITHQNTDALIVKLLEEIDKTEEIRKNTEKLAKRNK